MMTSPRDRNIVLERDLNKTSDNCEHVRSYCKFVTSYCRLGRSECQLGILVVDLSDLYCKHVSSYCGLVRYNCRLFTYPRFKKNHFKQSL